MKLSATANFDMTNWDEKPCREIEGQPKLARASVTNTYQGDITGEAALEYILIYLEKSCTFVGLERVIGRIGDRTGSFVLQHQGTFENNTATCTSIIVPDSGTGDLSGLRGEGSYVTSHGGPAIFTLNYEIV
jgi:hypothetical protein